MPDFNLDMLVNGGAGLAALYLAVKINATLNAVTKMLEALKTEVADLKGRVTRLEAGRTLGHATSGPCLQQNLVCVLEGES